MEKLIKCSCGNNEYPFIFYKDSDQLHVVECESCGTKITGFELECRAIEAWNSLMRKEYLVEPNNKDKLYGEHFKTKEHKETQCATCQYGEYLEDEWYRCCKCGTTSKEKIYECMGYRQKANPTKMERPEPWPEPPKPTQVGGNHYSKHKFQVWDIVDEYGLNFYEGTALKYLLRRKVDRLEDIKKCVHTLQKLIKNMEEGK